MPSLTPWKNILVPPRDSVRVWISEFSNTDFMAAGELLIDKQARLAQEQTKKV